MRLIARNVFLLGLIGIAFSRDSSEESSSEERKHSEKITIEPIVGRFDHSEGPHWDHNTQKLYFVDIEAQKFCRFATVIKELSCIYITNGPIGVAVPVQGEPDKFVAGTATDFALITWDPTQNVTRSTPETLAIVDKNRNGTRWNDGKVDSSGRFWGGTIGPEVNDVVVPNQASFYRIGSDLKPQVELSPVTNSNGLAWNYEDNTLYYIDTPTRKIAAFDFERVQGTISNKRIVFDLEKNNVTGLPDGMTIDRHGNLWIALYNGGAVAHVNPHTGRLLHLLKMPVEKVTSCTFGGPHLDTLFVTTSSRDLTAEDLEKQPYAGYVFAVHGLGVRGFKANSFKL